MNEYELCVLFGGNNTQEENNETAKTVENLLKDAGSQVKDVHNLGRRKLAYTIAGQAHGEYRVWLFLCEQDAMKTLNEKLRLSQSILRHLITKLESTSIEERIKNLKDVKSGRLLAQKEGQSKEEKPEHPSIQAEAEHKKDDKKASLDQLDKKLDELLKSDKI